MAWLPSSVQGHAGIDGSGMDSGKDREEPGSGWVAVLLRDEAAVREAFSQRPELMNDLLRNKGFLDTLFDAKSGAFATLLATPAEAIADMDALIGIVGGDGGSATPRQMTVAGKLGTWLADGNRAEQAFRAQPELTQALVANPAFVERVKVLKPEFFRELLNKGKECFSGDKAMLEAIRETERGVSTFTFEGGFVNEQAEAVQGERLVAAAVAGDEETIKSLLSRQDAKSFLDYRDENGRTAMMWAADNGRTETVKLLLDKGADPNAHNAYGWTALMLAAGRGNTEAVRLLLDKGAYSNVQNAYGRTGLIVATDAGRTEVVKLLLDSRTDPNVKTVSGMTALMVAAGRGNTEAVRLLLDTGADSNVQDDDGMTALMRAAGRGNTEAVRLLLDQGADPNVKYGYGTTAWKIAVNNGHGEIADVLSAAMKQKANLTWTRRKKDRGTDDRERGRE